MTVEELQELLSKPPTETVNGLQISSYPNLPKWSDLVVQYNPMRHKIMDVAIYPELLDDNQVDDFKRTPLGLQKLAVNRVAQSMFSVPAKRVYSYDRDDAQMQLAVDLIEEVYRTQNQIDSENINRAKQLNACCQIATVWYTYEEPNVIKEQSSKFKLTHRTYSEKNGYTLYPVLDSYGNILVVSIGYKDSNDVEHLDVYVKGTPNQYLSYVKLEDWKLDTEKSNTNLLVFPVVYAYLEEPVWNGDEGTAIVEQLEELESYSGMYIKTNAVPSFTLDYGEVQGARRSTASESSNNRRRIIEVGKGGAMKDVTWEGAAVSTQNRYNRLRNAFFEQIQVPDMSFSTLIASNTSADNKEFVLADAKAKARDLGGTWEKLFYDELIIVKKFLSIMFPGLSAQMETLSIRSTIQPYSIKTKKENAEYVSLAGGSMSLRTKVSTLGEVDDINEEVENIEAEMNAQSNQLL